MAALTLTEQLIKQHLVSGDPTPGSEIALRIDQTLTQDATGTLVMLELEALNLQRAHTEVSVQYVDHNLLQEDHKNPDDHLFLESAAKRFGLWFSRPGNGVSHPLHQQRFGKPGATLLGSDSHTCAAGALGMLAIGAGGLEVAMAIAGEPFYVKMPRVWNIRLEGDLPAWVSAKDIILELLRRHGVKGGVGYTLEYTGSGLEHLSAMDRHVIANMGAELGATASVFPSDEQTRRYLHSQARPEDWQPMSAEPDASYDRVETIVLDTLEPMIAKPTSPGNVTTVREVAGEPIYQAYVGSSANPGFRDFAVVAEMVRGKRVADGVSLDINPSSRQILTRLAKDGHLVALLQAGARLHQAGCNGCIGMGQAPATGRNSLRTVPRNFPGRSGTREDRVFLVSPETAAASALTGRITDPRDCEMQYPRIQDSEEPITQDDCFLPPMDPPHALRVDLVKGPNIHSLPESDPIKDVIEVPVLLSVGDNISTDEILPAGARVLPFRSNIPRISEFVYVDVDPDYVKRAGEHQGGHAIVGGANYGQGSSREHAAIAPRYLGLELVIAKSFARIHWQNLVNFGVLPLSVIDDDDVESLQQGDQLRIENPMEQIRGGDEVTVQNVTRSSQFTTRHDLSARQQDVLAAGGLIAWKRMQKS
ncbi:aconitate hydratase [Roseiconus nitratireducens]|uniref:Aconitate hydratase n=1 Tax=Roseiconus nitratireducens TaxID=2605748 RepID=A0A5M6D6Q7_9BACT|nr:aconitate hydratase [Roseiconus nitratireducens]KAA5543201.1 aconitate hydratase [Roseiconus nitratireducens]